MTGRLKGSRREGGRGGAVECLVCEVGVGCGGVLTGGRENVVEEELLRVCVPVRGRSVGGRGRRP